MIRIIAILCSLSDPTQCHEQMVTSSDFEDGLTMTACLTGMPALAEWMKNHPAERLVKWKCVIGQEAKGI